MGENEFLLKKRLRIFELSNTCTSDLTTTYYFTSTIMTDYPWIKRNRLATSRR